MLQTLDPILHAQLRLAVMSVLMMVNEADFNYLREQTGATAGNLSVQIDKLAAANYIEVLKLVSGKRTRTICRTTATGRKAFADYFDALRSYLPPEANAH